MMESSFDEEEIINVDSTEKTPSKFASFLYLRIPPIPPNPLTNWLPSELLSVTISKCDT